jgi:hypothetical protein
MNLFIFDAVSSVIGKLLTDGTQRHRALYAFLRRNKMEDIYTITAVGKEINCQGVVSFRIRDEHTPETLIRGVQEILFGVIKNDCSRVREPLATWHTPDSTVVYEEIKVKDCKGQLCLHAKRNPETETGWDFLFPESYPVSRMEKKYREEKEKENLPYHYRNLNLP